MLGFGDDTSIDRVAHHQCRRPRVPRANSRAWSTKPPKHSTRYDYARALERTETFFWSFTDNHVELVKARAYGENGDAEARSAQHALRLGLSTLLRLFAPLLPFVSEEVWSWWHADSVHQNPWPDAAAFREVAAGADPAMSDLAAEVLGEIRKAKTEAKKSLIDARRTRGPHRHRGTSRARRTCVDRRASRGSRRGAPIDTSKATTFAVAVTLAPE